MYFIWREEMLYNLVDSAVVVIRTHENHIRELHETIGKIKCRCTFWLLVEEFTLAHIAIRVIIVNWICRIYSKSYWYLEHKLISHLK